MSGSDVDREPINLKAVGWWFRGLLALSICCDLVAWTWRDVVYTRVLEPDLVKGDQELIITGALFVIGAVPLWLYWRYAPHFMVVLTALAVIGRITAWDTPYTITDGIIILEIIAATAWGAMLAIALVPGPNALFRRRART